MTEQNQKLAFILLFCFLATQPQYAQRRVAKPTLSSLVLTNAQGLGALDSAKQHKTQTPSTPTLTFDPARVQSQSVVKR